MFHTLYPLDCHLNHFCSFHFEKVTNLGGRSQTTLRICPDRLESHQGSLLHSKHVKMHLLVLIIRCWVRSALSVIKTFTFIISEKSANYTINGPTRLFGRLEYILHIK